MVLCTKELFILATFSFFLLSNCQLFEKFYKDENELRATENQQIIDMMMSKVTKLVLSALVEDFFTHMLHYTKNKDIRSSQEYLEAIVHEFKFSDPTMSELEEMKTKIFSLLDREDFKNKPNLSEHLITKYEDIVEYLKEKLLHLQDLLNTAKSKKNYNVIKSIFTTKNYFDITSFFFHLFEDIKLQTNKISDQKIKDIILLGIKHEMENWDKPRYKRSAAPDFYFTYADPTRYLIIPDIDKEMIRKEVHAMMNAATEKPSNQSVEMKITKEDNSYEHNDGVSVASSNIVRKKIRVKHIPKRLESSEESSDVSLDRNYYKSRRFDSSSDSGDESISRYSDPNDIDETYGRNQEKPSHTKRNNKKSEPKYMDEDHYSAERLFMGKDFDDSDSSNDEYYDFRLIPESNPIQRGGKFSMLDKNGKNAKFWICTTENNVKTITSSENILIPIALNKMFNDYFLYYTKSIKRNDKSKAFRLVTAPTNMKCKIIEKNFFNIKESLLHNLIEEIKLIKNIHT